MAAEDKRWRLLCYDVRDRRRYRRVYKIIAGHGTRLQYSVFRCRLDNREVERLRWRLARVMSPVDSLLILDLCPRCAARAISKNQVPGWVAEPEGFRIVASARKHGPDADHDRRG